MPKRANHAEPHAVQILQATMFGVDEDWFDAYWYDRQADARQHLPGRLARGLCDRIDAARASILAWPFRKATGYRFAPSPHWPDGCNDATFP